MVACAGAVVAQQPGASLRVDREFVLRSGQSQVLAWSADGRRIASGGKRGEVLVVAVETGDVVYESPSVGTGAMALCFAPDGARLAVAGRELQTWDAATGEVLAHRDVGGSTVLDWSRDGALLAVGRGRRDVDLLRPEDLRAVRTLELQDQAGIMAIAFSPDGNRIAVGKWSGDTLVVDAASGRELERRSQRHGVKRLAWLDDDRLLRVTWKGELCGRRDEPCVLGKNAWGMAVDNRGQLCVAWDSDCVRGFVADAVEPFVVAGNAVAAVRADGEQWVRAVAGHLEFYRGAQRVRRVALPHRAYPETAVITGDGRYLAVGDGDGGLGVFRIADGAPVEIPADLCGTPLPYDGGNELTVWSDDAQTSTTCRATLTWWSLTALAAGERSPVRKVPVPLTFALDKRRGVATTRSGRFAVGFRDVRDLMQPDAVDWSFEPVVVNELVPSPDGSSVAVVSGFASDLGGHCEIELVRRDGARVGPWEMQHQHGWGATWSRDGTRLGILSLSGLRLLDPGAMKETALVRGEWRTFEWVDGKHVLLGEYPRGVTLMDVDTQQAIARLPLPDYARVLTVDATGRLAVLEGDDRVLLVRIVTGMR